MKDWNSSTLRFCFVQQDPMVLNENLVANILNTEDYPKTEGFLIEDKNFHFIPTNLGLTLKNLLAMTIKKSNLRKITSENLQDFRKLMYLDLSFNQIEILEANLFANNLNLEMLWLNNNKIHRIDHKSFAHLKKLSSYNLEGNICINTEGKDVKSMNESISKSIECQNYVANLQSAMSYALDEIKRKDEKICRPTHSFEGSAVVFSHVMTFLDTYDKLLGTTCLFLLVVINLAILFKVCCKGDLQTNEALTSESHIYGKFENGIGKVSINSNDEKFSKYQQRDDQEINQTLSLNHKYEVNDDYDEIQINNDEDVYDVSKNSEEFYAELNVRTENGKDESQVNKSNDELYSLPIH